ncbi:MAG: hypothetical protein QOH23_641, partial [Gaiellaceae bacterium]|nr:hypothetical protein [Gaiellaceae bacterium]
MVSTDQTAVLSPAVEAGASAPGVSVGRLSATRAHVAHADTAPVSSAVSGARPAQSELGPEGALASRRARPFQSHGASVAPRGQAHSVPSSHLLESNAATSIYEARNSRSARAWHEPQAGTVGESGRPVAPRTWAWLAVALGALALVGGASLAVLRRMPGNAARIMVLSRLERILGRAEKAEDEQQEDLGG